MVRPGGEARVCLRGCKESLPSRAALRASAGSARSASPQQGVLPVCAHRRKWRKWCSAWPQPTGSAACGAAVTSPVSNYRVAALLRCYAQVLRHPAIVERTVGLHILLGFLSCGSGLQLLPAGAGWRGSEAGTREAEEPSWAVGIVLGEAAAIGGNAALRGVVLPSAHLTHPHAASRPPAGAHQRCSALLLFCNAMLGLLLPMALLAYIRRSQRQGPATTAADPSAAGIGAGGPREWMLGVAVGAERRLERGLYLLLPVLSPGESADDGGVRQPGQPGRRAAAAAEVASLSTRWWVAAACAHMAANLLES